jgi:hypothetical protein
MGIEEWGGYINNFMMTSPAKKGSKSLPPLPQQHSYI